MKDLANSEVGLHQNLIVERFFSQIAHVIEAPEGVVDLLLVQKYTNEDPSVEGAEVVIEHLAAELLVFGDVDKSFIEVLIIHAHLATDQIPY